MVTFSNGNSDKSFVICTEPVTFSQSKAFLESSNSSALAFAPFICKEKKQVQPFSTDDSASFSLLQ